MIPTISTLDYDSLLKYLEGQNTSHYGEDLESMLRSLRLEIDPAKVIVVAGTNGKGTTCAALQTLLREAGKNVGLFSSPHLEKVNERIKFNCRDVADEEFVRLFLEVDELIHDHNPSYFEYLTFMAANYFFRHHKNNIDFAIFEVGVGGTLDSTNVIPHDISVITKIGMDHMNILGNSLKEIARNKFGIIRSNNKVFHAKFSDEIADLANCCAIAKSAQLLEACDCSLSVDFSEKYPTFFIMSPWGKFPLPLPGKRAVENTALAMTVFAHIVPAPVQYMCAVEKICWPGRMEKISLQNQEIFFSGDHNVPGIESLLELLPYYMSGRNNVAFVVGICRDKEHRAMLQKLMDFPNSKLYLTETPIKTLKIQEYDPGFREMAIVADPNAKSALAAAMEDAQPNDLIVVTGSLYLVGLLRSLFL
ncbi:MAG: hypothetical protein LBT70_01200 [Holosporaceae bacterium]|jgi:dihydrofolate synthase/folylpolyglutamate synthase|nr:hypothetical protein [Holosporaceae bacterium]